MNRPWWWLETQLFAAENFQVTEYDAAAEFVAVFWAEQIAVNSRLTGESPEVLAQLRREWNAPFFPALGIWEITPAKRASG